MTTNHKERLSQAFLRPGRVDMLLEFNYLSNTQIQNISNHYIKNETVKNNFIKKVAKIKSTSACLTKFLFEYCMIQNIEDIDNDKYIEIYDNLCKQFNSTNNMFI